MDYNKTANYKYITLGFILLLLIAESISALLPAPPAQNVDDLLGPGKCPSGSFCIDTTYCTTDYFTTKAGLPFYCGPHYQIDSMICCVNTEPEIITPVDSQESFNLGEDISNEIHPGVLTNRSTEDDEVDILAVPFSNNQIDEQELPISEFEGRFDTWGDDLQSLIEDAIEHENLKQNIRETEPALKDFLDEQREYIFPSNTMKDPLPVYVADRGSVGPQPQVRQSENFDSRTRDARPLTPPEGQYNRNNCPCEKGEKGEPGPKGEPGEAGKIIYIPVFINAPGYYPSVTPGNNNPALSGAPLSINPSTPTNQPNLQTYYGQSNAPVPQHPNPTVVPYNVPINLGPNAPTQTSVPPPTQQLPQLAPQSYYAQNQQQQPSSAPYADSLEARATRHTMTDPRYANRRY
ncbi:hypothetical protein Ocin01_15819 [Orchesella cincta]|uniref:Uncharacterized protein n=1 Tax=Orchesella cincta TaxID=48709 RepID=A0A1D2MCY4_ORCCI|nr:hypothetical protein Ocin01_15819 [Orchesella cincta]